MHWMRALLLGVSITVGGAAGAEPSPYAGWEERGIKALSPRQIEDYLAGRGMRMALPAELNGYPGPRHVLELAAELDLTPAQLAQTRRLLDGMRRKAIELGQQIVAREAALERLFASATADAAALREITATLGRLNGELRAHHLGYHLAMRDLLDARQIHDYQRLRGYGSATGSGRHNHEGHGAQ